MYFSNSKKSVKDYKWKIRECDERKVLSLYQKLGVSEIVARLLVLRGIVSISEVESYLNPKLRNLLPDPFHLFDMDKAVDVVVDAIQQKKKIVIFGDYDVDGATSTALLKRFLASIGIDVKVYIPDRTKEGYGLNIEAVRLLKDQDSVDLIITLDCGISAHKAIDVAKELNVKVVVLDHHLGSEKLPNACAVVDPNRLDEKTEYNNIAAVGVCFLFCVGLNQKLREYYKQKNIKEPQILNLLDLVALGTVCDVMPLEGLNRAFVTQGLKILNKRNNLGIKKLISVGGIEEEIDVYHLGFVLGPRLNAGGRVGESGLGSRLLSTNDENEAEKIALILNDLNTQRQKLEKDILEQAILRVEEKALYKNPVIFVIGNEWHEGVIGIVASRLKDKYDKPTVVVTLLNGIGKASCRSVKGVDIGSGIIEAQMKEILTVGGGHAMAGGFTVQESRINDLREFFYNKFKKDVQEYSDNKEKQIDLVLECSNLNLQLVEELEKLRPYGMGNSKPKIVLKDVLILKVDVIGKEAKHLRCIIADKDVMGFSNGIIAMAFNYKNEGFDVLLDSKGKKFSLLGEVRVNEWGGQKKVQFFVQDIIV